MVRKNLVGENLKNIRKSMGLTQEEVALRSGLTQGYINQLESGKRMFTQKSLERIARGLNISIVDFFKEKVEGVKEDVAGYEVSKEVPAYKREVLALLDELPPQIRRHYINLLRLERDLWKKMPA
jgi:transcriptional regulator with XRE-family HTH domain